MSDSKLMPIGAFAKLSGMSASALRFYDDAGLLQPERVDPSTGYRSYSQSQLLHASQLRQLREIGMPLRTIARFFNATSVQAARLIDDHIAKVTADATGAQQTAAMIRAFLDEQARTALCALPGPVLAVAIDQVLATTVQDPDIPILGGVQLEAAPDALTLTATDRYRLTTRTLVPDHPVTDPWAGTLAGADLQIASSRLRRSPRVTLETDQQSLVLRMADGTVTHCRLLTEGFPDYRLLNDSLPTATHRVSVEKQQLVKALEQQAAERIGLQIVGGQPTLLLADTVIELNGAATGADLTVWFELTTLYPALSHALGNDVMIDLRGIDQPATMRSADSGDLTTLVMPCQSPRP